VRVRDHMLLSTGSATLLYPWLRRRVLVPWAASMLIDADHYLWFCLHKRTWNPMGAMRFFNQAEPPQHIGTRLFHHPGTLLLTLLLGVRYRWAVLIGLGLAFHTSLDTYHETRLNRLRPAVLRRDRHTCQQCGARGPGVVAHLAHQPKLLPSYRLEHFVSLCPRCHEQAHTVAPSHGPRSSAIAWSGYAAYLGSQNR